MAKEGISAQEWEIMSREKQIMDKFNNGSYKLYQIPCALSLENGKVYYVGKNVHDQDPIESLERDSDLQETGAPNLKVEFYFRSALEVGMINKKFLPSRGDLDRLSFEACCPPSWKKFKEEKVKKLGSLLFEDAMKIFHCTISCNMEHYLPHKDETEKNLNCQFNKLQLSDEGLKQSQEELFYKSLIDIFGSVKEEDEKEEQEKQTIILKDFRLTYENGEFKIATAERGNHYIAVYWMCQAS